MYSGFHDTAKILLSHPHGSTTLAADEVVPADRAVWCETRPDFLGAAKGGLTEAGYVVLESLTAKGGMALLDKSHEEISVLIVDLILPGYSGHEVIAAVKRRSTGIKVIATTAVLKQTQLEIIQYLGADAVLRKNAPDTPFARDEWLQTIKTVLS